MKLIIIQGGAATGKSTLGLRLAQSLGIPLFRKDEYKEKSYDQAGKKLGLGKWFGLERESYAKVCDAAGEAVRANTSLIIEGNFLPFHRRRLKALLEPNCTVVEIYCYARGRLMLKRYVGRNENGTRHPGHRDRLWYGIVFLEALCAGAGWRWYRPLRLSRHLYKVDTSEPQRINYQKITSFIKAAGK